MAVLCTVPMPSARELDDGFGLPGWCGAVEIFLISTDRKDNDELARMHDGRIIARE